MVAGYQKLLLLLTKEAALPVLSTFLPPVQSHLPHTVLGLSRRIGRTTDAQVSLSPSEGIVKVPACQSRPRVLRRMIMKTRAAFFIAALLVAVTLMSVGAAVAQEDNFVYQPKYTCTFTRTPSGFRESCGPQVKKPTECPKGQVLVKMLSYGVRSARCVPVRFSAREE
jgi:hypothetical protein